MRVAKDLGIRYADASAGRMNTPGWRYAQTRCTERSLTEIARMHHVSIAEITTLAGTRELWIDLLAVLLPVAIIFATVSRVVAARVAAEYDRKDRAVVALVLTTVAPLAAGIAVALAQIWGVLVEQLRLRDEHISYRGFELPASRHGWLLWAIAMALFVGIAATELLRERAPTRRRNRTPR